MEMCSFNHKEIVYADGNCPLCDLKVEHDMAVEALKDDILVLEDTIKGFKDTTAMDIYMCFRSIDT